MSGSTVNNEWNNRRVEIPVRVPIITPPSGVNPIEVSTDLPPSTAVIETPFPTWAVIIFVSSIGFLVA